jgi:hypothetical protein
MHQEVGLIVENAIADADSNAQMIRRQRAVFRVEQPRNKSVALTAARNTGLKVNFEVEGKSLRKARSRLMLRASMACPGFADVYAMIVPSP